MPAEPFQTIKQNINKLTKMEDVMEYLQRVAKEGGGTVSDVSNVLKFVIKSLVPRLIKYLSSRRRMGNEESASPADGLLESVVEVVCSLLRQVRNHDQLEFVLLVQYLLSQAEEADDGILAETEASRTKQELTGQMWVLVYQKAFGEQWPIELLLSHQGSATSDFLVRLIFNLRDQFISAIKFCPRIFIEKSYFEQVFASLLGPNYPKITERSVLIDKIALLGKIQFLSEAHLTPAVQSDIHSSAYKSKYLCSFIKRQIPFDSSILFVTDELNDIDKHILAHKHGSKQMADFLLERVVRPSGLQADFLGRLLVLWGSQRSFVQIASLEQQLYVTYLVYHIIEDANSTIYDHGTILSNMQQGVQFRIGSGELPKLVQDMGLLIWKQYAQKNDIKLEEPEDPGDDEIPFEEITADSIFAKMDKPSSVLQIVKKDPPPKQPEPEQQVAAKQMPNKFYTQDDSDNDSDFSLKYEQAEDDFSDVQKTVLPQRPLFIQDLIQGLQSDDYDRFSLAIDSMQDLITNQQSNDLDTMCSELIQNMFRATNKYEEADFLEKKYKAIVALIVQQPRQSLQEIVSRILDSETSLGEKVILIECLPTAAVELSNFNIEHQNDNKSIQDKIKKQQTIDNEFFGIHDLKVNQVGTILKESQSRKKMAAVPQKNEFYPFAEAFIYSILHLVSQSDVLGQPVLAGRVLCALSAVLDAAQNHWRIIAISSDIFESFLRLKSLVSSDRLYTDSKPSSSDSLSQTQCQFKIGLASCLAKISRHLSSTQKDEAMAWLGDQVEMYGGDETFQSQETINVKELCMLVMQIINQS